MVSGVELFQLHRHSLGVVVCSSLEGKGSESPLHCIPNEVVLVVEAEFLQQLVLAVGLLGVVVV